MKLFSPAQALAARWALYLQAAEDLAGKLRCWGVNFPSQVSLPRCSYSPERLNVLIPPLNVSTSCDS
ncbi:uncharacterized protein DFL_001480 [Arthrobotrys flagrans]|uniref:Uncharacterized protein n=1 Tax=Arthrobotrys flagrans TaxID=97331 RepID=A0A437A7X9_ARTFL|nr:hypothetical protein DFL_001480 [Arthrobotrys flagrans]